ncbi:response regulator [Panacagrimonas sp.]|uniref:response regulator n=1 Tax=Panacagrimonas sp. TaxID=2480088 RepID=UPI003B518803
MHASALAANTQAPPHIVVVDDDPEIRQLLSRVLERYGFRATSVSCGSGLWPMIERDAPDLVVLDLMLPGDDGLSLCRSLRRRSGVPVIMLTARAEPVDRIVGLEVGADDYIAKPFDPRELIARIRTVLRRIPAGHGSPTKRREYAFEGWTLDLTRRELRNPQAVVVPLSSLEYRLLELLLSTAGQVLTRDRIMEAVVGRPADPFERRIDIAISRLRNRIGDGGREPALIKTVRNRGYVFAAEVRSQ